MKNLRILPVLIASTLISMAFISCDDKDDMGPGIEMPGTAPDVNFTALSSDNEILMYNAKNLAAPISSTSISGLESGEMILSIDYRPATGQLYALSSMSRLYHINENSGAATVLGISAFSPGIQGANASIDFNPTVDRIRLVTESGQNLRLHPELGTVVATDGTINGGNNPKIGAVAYSNSFSGTTSTTLFDIDFAQDKLYKQVPPNDGGLEEVGNLEVDFEGIGDMDLNPDNSVALAVNRKEEESRLYTINLTSGKALWIGTFTQPVVSLAFKTNPIAYATDASNKLYRFDPTSPNPIGVDITGLKSGEKIVGLDFRPVNGQLLAVSNMSQLYSVNPSSGAVAAIGNPFNPAAMGSFIGFDFNPTVDRIRLITETGQNLRLHPDLGTVVAIDGSLNPGTPKASGAAYTKSFAGTTTTTLFVVDAQNDMLYQVSPPNDGVLVAIGPLGINLTDDNGFDIGGTSDKAYGVFTVGGTAGVYSVNLMTGAASKVSDLNFTPTSMALGLGF
ncbi:uncharacterized protein DUF4394 [Algoriphagus ratkowskyi]|uniref:DUF4394 domain-containing protein n=1 Tax=Algoriphagus ratkowskyi TaxID=57028 RepID=A0A2W7QV17_9BACT|nr:DUF4394 domain-containing protein [Algoriphagus ratkowskyi]PZX52418.1 uncharacterized protein DUF4394 [Algoriphagus ratkowskyi]TXD76234.1 DUF4394 domain-containing protein [Algoriphagus ratkowskyi]